MSCGGRIYKGGMTTVSIPFNVEGYSNLSISYFTSGDYKITKAEEDLVIADGFITYTFTKEELDVMPDGVLNYLVNYEVEGGKYADGGNTNVYLKTPQDYSATSVTEMVQSAYTEGHEIGYVEGHAQGKQEGEEVGYNEAVSVIRNQSISLSVTANGTYTANTQDSIYFNEVNVNVPQSSGGSVDLSWAGKACAFEGEGWSHLEDPEDEYDYCPFFTLPNFGSFDQLSLDVFIINTYGNPYIMSTQDLDGTRHYLNIRANDSGFTVEYKDEGSPSDHEVHLPCTMYSYSNYHIDITITPQRGNMTIIVVGPDGQGAVSATTTLTQFDPRRPMCINGVRDNDLKIYDFVRGGFMFRNMRIYGTGTLMHNYQWYDGHIVDTISGNDYYGWHYYWDEDEEQWDTEIKYMNGYNDAYGNN